MDELAQQRADEIEYLDSLENWRDAKQMWKEANPHENLKTYKKAYIRGFIDKLGKNICQKNAPRATCKTKSKMTIVFGSV